MVVLVVALEVYKNTSSQVSLLNASISSKFEEFNFKNIEVPIRKEDQAWFERAHVKAHVFRDRRYSNIIE